MLQDIIIIIAQSFFPEVQLGNPKCQVSSLGPFRMGGPEATIKPIFIAAQ